MLPGVILVWPWWRRRGNDSPWRSVVDPSLLPHLLVDQNAQRGAIWPLVMLTAGYLVAVFALAGPAIERFESASLETVRSRIIVLDLSTSMNSPDVSPTRLERARFKIRDVLDHDPDAYNGLVVFSGDAFTVSPLTRDVATLANLLDALSTDIMPVTGNRVDRAIDMALRLLDQGGSMRGEILLLSDGVSARSIAALENTSYADNIVNVIAVGTPDGAPIPLDEGGFVKDEQDNILIQGLDFNSLESLAQAGNGLAVKMTNDDADLDALSAYRAADESARKVEHNDTRHLTDIGPWLVLLILPMALLAFRRGWLLACILCLWLPRPSLAFEWTDLWQRADQQAANALEKGDFETASARTTPWQGAALYRAGKYDDAAEAFTNNSTEPSSVDHYNRGNALARSGHYQQALQAYQAALEQSPGFGDAQFNRDLVDKLLAQQNKSSNKSDGQSGDGKESANGEQNSEDGMSSTKDGRSHENDAGKASASRNNQASSSGNNSQTPDGEVESGVDSKGHQSGTTDDKQSGQTMSGNKPEAMENGADSVDSTSVADNNSVNPTTGEAKGESIAKAEVSATDQQSSQELQQWLRQIPEDPEGLLRRKFLLQYRQRQGQ